MRALEALWVLIVLLTKITLVAFALYLALDWLDTGWQAFKKWRGK